VKIKRNESIAKQINKIVRTRIRKGIYPPGSRLPSEKELTDEFGVSRSTLRLAFAPLIDSGIVWRRQGDGTYVNKKALEYNTRINSFKSFFTLIEESGKTPSFGECSCFFRSPTDNEIGILELESEVEVLDLRQLTYADGLPAIFSNYVVPRNFLSKDIAQLDPETHILSLLNEHGNRNIFYMTSDISASLGYPDIDRLFNVQHPTPFLKQEDVFYDADDTPIVFCTNYCDHSIIRLGLIHKWHE